MKKFLFLVPVVLFAVTVPSPTRLNAQDDGRFEFKSGTLVLSRSVYEGKASTITIGETLPLGCQGGTTGLTVQVPLADGSGTVGVAVPCGVASDNGEYPNLNDTHNVWNNSGSDGSFGITSPILLDDITTSGELLGTLPVPTNQMVTSFS